MNKLKIPLNSYHPGFTDEGISEALGKSEGFRYSDLFLKRFYSEEWDD